MIQPTMRITLDLQDMKEQIHGHLMLRENTVNEMARKILDEKLTGEYLLSQLEKSLMPSVDRAIASAVENFFLYGEGRDAIESTLKLALSTKFKLTKSA